MRETKTRKKKQIKNAAQIQQCNTTRVENINMIQYKGVRFLSEQHFS